ncbi:MAG: cupin domain-containing protein [Dehalococcoidales bacterium]|nr:cupin domain-containing protein [Dehalococcoidales bacterium]MDZ4245735.1 cupin domain-containing protein [Dehalococcoidia bacterium]
MVEKVTARKREPEPSESLYDVGRRALDEAMRKKLEGKVIVKGKDIDFEQNRQGIIKYLLHRKDWDNVGTPGWHIFIHRILKHSGKHVHQGGLAIFVIGGKGYTVVDGQRYDWEDGDLILLPVKPGGVEHQHFNDDPANPAEWMAFIYHYMLDPINMGITQKAEHPDWVKPKA